MKKKTLFLFLILFFFSSVLILPKENPWGNLKKIHFYDSVKDYHQVLTHLEHIDFEGLKRGNKKEIASKLVKFGDHYFDMGMYQHAEAFYRKVLAISPDFWYLYNKLEKINRINGRFFIGFDNLFKQAVLVMKNFNTSFLVINHFFTLLFFSGLLVFFFFSAVLFIKYFKLAGNDLIIGGKGKETIKKAGIVILLILWPLLLSTGWMIYPFLIAGFLWLYLNENEKKAIIYTVIGIAVLSLLYSLNLMLESNLKTEEFKRIQKVYDGHLFERDEYETFDNKLNVIQAYSYYENGKYDTALDILNLTGENFKSTSKLVLLGNIYFKYGEISESIKYYRQALLLDDKNKIALNNFTLALSKNNNPTVFKSYAERYPEIETYRSKAISIKDIKIDQGDLWKRLFNFSGETFKPGLFLQGLLGEFAKLPVVYYILLFFVYVVGLKKITPALGESIFCSKCSKIIKEALIHRSYKLCDECHQLFSIKDVIFLEAKILKEKELKKKFGKKYIFYLLFSLLIPGLNFSQKENNRLFLILCTAFYFLAGFALVGAVNFNRIFSTSPLFLNLIGAFAFILYLVVNIFSVIGDENGF